MLKSHVIDFELIDFFYSNANFRFQIVFSNVQNIEHQEVMGQPQNQTIMITSNLPQTPQQPPQTPPIQSVCKTFQPLLNTKKKHLSQISNNLFLPNFVFFIQGPGGMMQGQPQMQKMHVQNQIVLTSNQSPQHGGMQMQPMSVQQQQQQKPGPPLPGQPQFIRSARYVYTIIVFFIG